MRACCEVHEAAKERRRAFEEYLNATRHREVKAALEAWTEAEDVLDSALDAAERKTA